MKLENCAGRYTFVWRKSVEKHLARIRRQIFEEMGLTSPSALRTNLDALARTTEFVHGSSRRKSVEQKRWERLSKL